MPRGTLVGLGVARGTYVQYVPVQNATYNPGYAGLVGTIAGVIEDEFYRVEFPGRVTPNGRNANLTLYPYELIRAGCMGVQQAREAKQREENEEARSTTSS